jgi:hypothetical protein
MENQSAGWQVENGKEYDSFLKEAYTFCGEFTFPFSIFHFQFY